MVERACVLKGFQANKTLRISNHLNLLNQFFIGEPQVGLDNQYFQCNAKGFCRHAKALEEVRHVIIL